jgi:Rrf2 family transcriptional regulator, iron-sulfur cluster assembly transcription factor
VKFSAQEEYGLRCLLQLGMQGEGGSLTISELSQREGISVPNVAKMMRVMRRAGFVCSTRGKDGGYTLARPAGQLRIGDVLGILGGRLYEAGFCERHAGVEQVCSHETGCSIRSVWQMVQSSVDQVLSQLTLQDLLPGHKTAGALPPVPLRGIPLPLLRDAQR